MPCKKLGHRQFTEKALRESKSTCKGDDFEKKASKYLFQFGTPVLISSQFLRSLGAGQIDYAYYDGVIHLVEIKSHKQGITTKQLARLNNSVKVLAEIFDCDIQIRVLNHLPKN